MNQVSAETLTTENTNCYVKYNINIPCDLQYNQFNLSIGLYLSYYTTRKHEWASHSNISSVIVWQCLVLVAILHLSCIWCNLYNSMHSNSAL